jgi:2-hydroxycyclohexanecarboxyl-CoA dehydrogenase
VEEAVTARLHSRVAFVTGGGAGIGAATVRRLSAEGARVVVADIDEVAAKDVADACGGLACFIDVTEPLSVREAIAAGEVEMGPIDILVNNAGGDRFAFFVDTDEADWDRSFHLNLRSTFAATHAVLPGMQSRRRGSIVNVASEAGRVGTMAGALYSATKAGVIGFTKAVAREAGRYGVRCNAVAPGPTDTPGLGNAAESAGELGRRVRLGMVASTVLNRLGTADETAAAVAYLASDDASYVTGETLAVSGGLSMW